MEGSGYVNLSAANATDTITIARLRNSTGADTVEINGVVVRPPPPCVCGRYGPESRVVLNGPSSTGRTGSRWIRSDPAQRYEF